MGQIEQFLVELDRPALRSRLPDDVRGRMRELLSLAAAAIGTGEAEVARDCLRRAAHDIGDVWPFDVKLGSRILAFQQRTEEQSEY